MPAPKPDDPLYCPGSGTRNAVYQVTDRSQSGWHICLYPKCYRALHLTPKGGVLRPHRIRSRTTAALDKTRDVLADITPQDIEENAIKQKGRHWRGRSAS